VVVKGIYWPLSDLDVNTAANSIYSGHYTVIPDHNMLAFEYPVVRLDGGELSAAELKVWLSYNAVGPTGEYIDEAIFQQVPNAIASTSPRVEKRNYLKRIRNFASPYGPTVADNIATVIGEANEYLDNIVGTYNGGPEVDMLYDGFEPINLSGCIAQVGFRWGNSRVATTRGSENHEFDCSIRSHQERRRVERLGQLFDKVMES
jgi:hypothetical protein